MKENTLRICLTPDRNMITRDVACERILEIAVDAPEAKKNVRRQKLNLALVIDRSGSMGSGKLEYVKQAASRLVDMLEDSDQLALVEYDERVTLLFKSQLLTSTNRVEIKESIAQLSPRGSTNLGGGWMAGCEEVAAVAAEGTINRVLLLTDGLANQGITDPALLAKHASEISQRGVTTSTFGVGLSFNEYLLEAMAGQGGGNYYFIESLQMIDDIFQREFKELQALTARDVNVTLSVPKGVNVKILGAWRVTSEAEKLRINLGSLVSGRHQEVFARLLTPPSNGEKGLHFKAEVSAGDENGDMLRNKAEMELLFGSAEEVQNAPENIALLQRFAVVDVAETAAQALQHERRGDRETAHRLMQTTINANLKHLPREQAEQYRHMAERMNRGMNEFDRKISHQQTYYHRHQRDENKKQ